MLWLLAVVAAAAPCPFDAERLAFTGTPVEQARCLMRPVGQWGRVQDAHEALPDALERRIGQPVQIPAQALGAWLQARGVAEQDVGGPLPAPLCHARNGDPSAPQARYFVIHDTSTPIADMNGPFPADIDAASWRGNDMTTWTRPIAHVFVNRLGASTTTADFSRPSNWATKFERDNLDRQPGLFLNIELVQPRRRDPAGGPDNDAIAPEGGFTDAQLDRLALLYVAASVRGGRWLVPAFHSVVDNGIAGAHDDPQRFDTARWAERLDALVAELTPAP